MANEFIARKGIINLGNTTVTGDEVITGSLTVLGGITGAITGSATSASYAANASFLNNSGSGEFVPTGSFNTFSSSILTYTGSANSRFSSIESTTASLNSASGSAITRLNALEVTSGSNITRISALEVASGSAISRLSSLEARTGSYATTGSNTFIGNQTITGSIFGTGSLTINGCITATGQIVAQTINVQQVTSSIVYSCGSNILGTLTSNTQTLCGNVFNTGSVACFSNAVCSNTVSTTDGTNVSTLANNYLRYNGGDFYVDACAVGGNFRIRTSNVSALDNTALFICGTNSRVGIGTTTPSYKLDVAGDLRTTQTAIIGNGAAQTELQINSLGGADKGPFIRFQKAGAAKGYIGAYSAIINGTSDDLTYYAVCSQQWMTNNSTSIKMLLDGSGNLMVGSADAGNAGTINVSVGVAGTTAGGLQLWAASNQTHYIQFGDGTTGGQPYAGYVSYAHGTDSLAFGTATATRATISSTGVSCFSNTVCAPMILASGCVGVNITDPLTRLHVQFAGTTTTTCMACLKDGALVLYNANAGSSTNGTVGIFGQNAGALGLSSGIGFSRESSANWGTQLRFYTHPTTTSEIDVVCERMRITSDGYVGIGVTSPSLILHTSADGAAGQIMADQYGAVGSNILLRSARGTSASPTATQAGDLLGSIGSRGYDGSAFSGGGRAGIYMYAGENFTSTNQGTFLIIGTTALGAASRTERIRVTTEGSVGIGTTSPDIFGRGDGFDVGISSAGISSTQNMSLQLNAGATAGRGAQIYMGQGGTRHFTISSNVTESTIGTTSNTPLRFVTCDSLERLRITAAGIACFACQVCAPQLYACVSSAAAITIDGYSKLSFADRGTEYGAINASRYNFGGNTTMMTFQSGNCFLFLNGLNCLMFISPTGEVGIKTTSTSTEANLFLGAQGPIEGGQLVLQKGTSCSCATHLDNYQDSFRVLVGTDTGSTGVHMSINHKTGIVCTPFGVKFGGGGGVLNYYEEGTFTPCMSIGGMGVYYSNRAGSYIKVGNLVTVQVYLAVCLCGTYTGASFNVTNLPFAVSTATNVEEYAASFWQVNATGVQSIGAVTSRGSTQIGFACRGTNGAMNANLAPTADSTVRDVNFTVTYKTS